MRNLLNRLRHVDAEPLVGDLREGAVGFELRHGVVDLLRELRIALLERTRQIARAEQRAGAQRQLRVLQQLGQYQAVVERSVEMAGGQAAQVLGRARVGLHVNAGHRFRHVHIVGAEANAELLALQVVERLELAAVVLALDQLRGRGIRWREVERLLALVGDADLIGDHVELAGLQAGDDRAPFAIVTNSGFTPSFAATAFAMSTS